MKRIQGLDGLRAVAFLLVFFFHVYWFLPGWIGVQLFFVLSGFLITGILLDMKERLVAKDFFIKFYGRRFLRIFPLYYFYLLATTLLVSWLLEQGFRVAYMRDFQEQLPYALTYSYNFYFATSYFERPISLLTHFWSLAVEEQFYFVWPFLIFLTPRKYARHVFLGVIAFSPLFRLGITIVDQNDLWSFLSPIEGLAAYVLPFSHLDAFAFGALLNAVDLPKAKQQFWALLLTLPVVGALTDYLAAGTWEYLPHLGLIEPLTYAYKPVWGYSALDYLFALLVYGVAREGWWRAVLDSRPMSYLGKISYGLYVYHSAIIWFIYVWIGHSQLKPFPIWAAALALGLTILIAGLSYRFMEKPLIDLKDRFFPI